LLDTRSTKIAPADGFGNVGYPGGKLLIDTRSESLSPGSPGTYYAHGYYDTPAAETNRTQAAPTQTWGSAGHPYGAHAILVAGSVGTASGGVGAVEIEVSGESITDGGVRTPGDTEIVVADITAMNTDYRYQTDRKWIGQIVYTLKNASGSTQTTFALDFNYGYSKYEDWGNKSFTITDFEVKGRATANDSGFDVGLFKDVATGWTYSAGAFIPGDGAICEMSVDYNTTSIVNGQPISYKRDNLNVQIAGDVDEGVIVRVITTANNAVDLNIHIGAEFV